MTEKSCSNCHGMGQIEQGTKGPVDCGACKGKGLVKVVENVDHWDNEK